MMGKHLDFEVSPCVFLVDLNIPYIAASLDGLVECTCCNKGVIEIKCPYCAKDVEYLHAVAEKHKNSVWNKEKKGYCC